MEVAAGGVDAGVVDALMGSLQTYWGLNCPTLCSATEELSHGLQGKEASAQEAHIAYKVRKHLHKRHT